MIIPQKLKKGDMVRVVSPSRSFALIDKESKELAKKRFKSLSLSVSFGKNCDVIDSVGSSSIDERVSDLHEAFLDPSVKCVIASLGGYNSNQLLSKIDYDIIKNNAKIFCGFSDINSLSNAIYAKTGLVTYTTPNYSSFGMKKGFEYSFDCFRRCLFQDGKYSILPAGLWSEDSLWYKNQESRNFNQNSGFFTVNEGEAEGTIIGGNLSTFQLLRGTDYMPKTDNAVLFLEEDYLGYNMCDDIERNLQSIINLNEFKKIKAVVFGRFHSNSGIDEQSLRIIVKSKKEFGSIPIIGGVDFGHTTPQISYPIGGKVQLSASGNKIDLSIIDH